MPTYTQTHRPLAVTTPLGPDKLLLTAFRGTEALSQLFSFQLDLIAETATNVAFDKLLGHPVSVRLDLPGDKKRFFSGICIRFSQGETDATFTAYHMEIVPKFWLWTKNVQSRIFQHVAVPDILKTVLKGLEPTFELHGTFSRAITACSTAKAISTSPAGLMEEEGIYYYFKHSEKGDQLVVANTPQSHTDLPIDATLLYKTILEGDTAHESCVHSWIKTQELTSGKVTLWDHCFELPHKHLEADKTIQETVQVGKVSHKLKVGGNGQLEIYDYPGGYAQRFDGVDKGGGDQAGRHAEDLRRQQAHRWHSHAAGGDDELADRRRRATAGSSSRPQVQTGPGAGQGRRQGAKADGEYVLTARHASGDDGERLSQRRRERLPLRATRSSAFRSRCRTGRR